MCLVSLSSSSTSSSHKEGSAEWTIKHPRDALALMFGSFPCYQLYNLHLIEGSVRTQEFFGMYRVTLSLLLQRRVSRIRSLNVPRRFSSTIVIEKMQLWRLLDRYTAALALIVLHRGYYFCEPSFFRTVHFMWPARITTSNFISNTWCLKSNRWSFSEHGDSIWDRIMVVSVAGPIDLPIQILYFLPHHASSHVSSCWTNETGFSSYLYYAI